MRLKTAAKASVNAAQLAGLAAVVDGVWRVYMPAGIIAAGVLLVLLAEVVDRYVR